jgi:EAL domain-containing protein (putative c-di-GMP-specific phosphodiesterase class I)
VTEPATTIHRVLVVTDDEYTTQALDEAAAAFGLLVRQIRSDAAIEAVVRDFGPEAVIVDPASVRDPQPVVNAVAQGGSALLLLGGPADAGLRSVQQAAAEAGLRVDGLLEKPLLPESLEIAMRVIVGELGFSAADIAAAVMRGEMTAWYQLQLVRAGQGWRAAGAEALARWQHPDYGPVMPGAFVPVAEAEGQIAAITDCVLQTAVQQLGVWQRQGLDFRVGVNLSPVLISDPDFPERLSRLLHEYDVQPRAMLLEIPEPALALAPPGFLGMLARLRVHGFGLALEHFGAGVSSVAELYRTPFSELKIDRTVVSRLDEDEDARQLVRGILLLARELGLDTCAEAVETQETLDFLHEAGCNRVQGFHISRALPAAAFQLVAAQWL